MAAKKKTKRGREQKWKDLKAQEGVFTHTILRAILGASPRRRPGAEWCLHGHPVCIQQNIPFQGPFSLEFHWEGLLKLQFSLTLPGRTTSPGPAPLRTPVHFLLRSPCLGRGKAADPEGPWATFNRIQVVHEPRGKRDTYLHKCQKSWLGKLTFP